MTYPTVNVNLTNLDVGTDNPALARTDLLDLATKFNGLRPLPADLAASSGASLVGYDGDTVQAVLDASKPMQSYTPLRAYTGRATSVRITSVGLAGYFWQDASDTTSADNGGTIIVDASSRRWKRLQVGPLNVRWFGAKGDGMTDDIAAIQVAVSFATSTAYDRDVFFPFGKYRITSSLSIPSSRNIHLRGEAGPFTGTQIYVDFNGAGIYSTVAQTWSATNLQFSSNATTYPQSYGVRCIGTGLVAQVYMQFNNCTFNNIANGISLSNPFVCRFDACEFASIDGIGLQITGGSGCILNSPIFEQSKGYGLQLGGTGHTINGPYFENNAQSGGGIVEAIISGDHITVNGGVIAPATGLLLPPILVTGNMVTFVGTKGYGLPAGSGYWINVSGAYANVLLVGSELTYMGSIANVIQILPGVPGSNIPDIKIGKVSAIAGISKAWVNFDGTPTGTYPLDITANIRSSSNVARIIKNAIADYTITFTNAMVDAAYCMGGSANLTTIDGTASPTRTLHINPALAASCRIQVHSGAGVATDCNIVMVTFDR